MVKDLKGSDIILNLKEIGIGNIDCFSSSSCSGRASFSIECETENGYCEDPDFTGKIEILEAKKAEKEKNVFVLKVRFVKEENPDKGE